MSVQTLTVTNDENDIRLDRWFKRRFPGISHGQLEKLLRTGQVRVDGKRAKSNNRIVAGQVIRVPPLGGLEFEPPRAAVRDNRISDADAELIQNCVIYMDDSILVINKPPGLATQGGTGVTRHVDGLLDALRFGNNERPRLVHRLDKDTSGVMLLGRTATATAHLAKTFKTREARKLYWCLVVGYPQPHAGTIRAPLVKAGGHGVERMAVDPEKGQPATTEYRVVDHAGNKVSWMEVEPRTGRTHQIRVHAAVLGTPILGDGKYGGQEAHLQGTGVSRKLHLHARALRLPHPDGGTIFVTAPMPEHMETSFDFFGFQTEEAGEAFAFMPDA